MTPYGAPRDMPETPYGERCRWCTHRRVVVPAASVPHLLVWLCMSCDHGGAPRATAPILQGYIDRGGQA